MGTTTLHRAFATAPLLLPTLACLFGASARAEAQEHAARMRPVPRLAGPQALPEQLPRSLAAGNGAPFALLQRDRKPVVLWTDNVAHETEFARDPGAAVEPIHQGKNGPHSLQVGDFDGDGADDVVARFVFGLTHLVVDQNATREPKSVRVEEDGPWFAGRAADWNGDGLAEIAFFSGSRVMLHHKVFDDGPTTVLLDLGPDQLPPDATAAGTIGDWDLDGFADLVLALPDRGLVWCRNEGAKNAPKFSAPIPLWPSTPGTVVTSLVLFPVDDDPWPDLVVSTATQGFDEAFGFVMRAPRLRTPAEESQLRTAKGERQALQRARNPVAGLERLGVQRDENPFDRLLEQKRIDDHIARLRWNQVPMIALPPYVQLRTRR